MAKFEVAERRLFNVKICVKCNAKNAWKATKCRKCIPAGTSVFTGSDFKPIEAIKVGETVRGLHSPSLVLKTHEHDYNGELVKLRVRYLGEFSFTPEHPILIKTFFRKARWKNNVYEWTLESGALKWEEASKVRGLKKGFQCVAVPKLEAEEDIFLDFNPFVKKSMRILPWLLKPRKLDKRLAELMGWYVAGGCSCEQGIVFCLGSEEKRNIRRVCSLINSLGFRASITYFKKRGVTVRCFSRVLARAFAEWFGKRAENKRVSGFLFKSKDNIIKSFLTGYVKGDGCISHKDIKTSSRSENLTRQIQMLFMKVGIIGGVSTKLFSNSTIGSRRIRGGKQFVFSANLSPIPRLFHEDENHYYFPISKVTREGFSGKVFNLTTTDNTYSLPFILHNCGYHGLRPKSREPRG